MKHHAIFEITIKKLNEFQTLITPIKICIK